MDPDIHRLILGNPVARATAILGDSWTQLILREAFFGVRRFTDWRDNLGLPRTVLSERLQRLVAKGLLTPHSAGSTRPVYRLTPMGLDLYGVALMQGQWERRYAPTPLQNRYAVVFYDRASDRRVRPGVLSRPFGQAVGPRDVTWRAGPGLEPQDPPPWRRRRSSAARTDRPMIERSVELIGDYWAWTIVSAAFFRVRRYDDFLHTTGMATNILADRLSRLVAAGIFERRPYPEGGLRLEYRLTRAGLDLYPIVLAMHGWAERWLCDFDNPPLVLIDPDTGERITPVVCDLDTGEPIDAHRIRWAMEAPAGASRPADLP